MANYWFISPQYRQHGRLALFTFLLAFVVILLGAYTRLTDAGLSCPDWPHCYGYITAPHTNAQIQMATQNYPLAPVDVKKAWTEMTHRYFAGTEGILILILAFSILFARKAKDLKSAGIALGLIGLLFVQVMLGMLTVTEKLKPVIVLSHLLTGLSLLSLLWWAYLDLYLRNDRLFATQLPTRITPWIGAGFIIIALQITLGGWVSTHYAGLACVDFPYCNGQLLPAMLWDRLNTDLITIHMLHRLGAMVTGVYLGALGLYLATVKSFRVTGAVIITLVILQITLGILNIVWLRPVWVALIHQAVAILLLLTIITAWVKASLVKGNHHDSRIS
ncbi:Heme A synthase [Aquicella siphonis]|uniref:Heme A synthase n=1 Tax=Aquicella siphonis TaxID=254247 RepID=A0A5E4PJR7_9COXI|nr:COX15/CtaA family protein [Aquicella siphonis]VVC76805.1 Heme A synthase [Aquicella siphonis]